MLYWNISDADAADAPRSRSRYVNGTCASATELTYTYTTSPAEPTAAVRSVQLLR